MSALTFSQAVPAVSDVFSTLVAPPSRRLALWQEHLRRHAPAFRCAPLGSDDLRISMRRTRLGRVEVVEVSGDGNLMERTPELVAATPGDSVAIGILLRGTAFVSIAGRIEALAAGDVLLHDSQSLCSYGRSAGFAEVVVSVPREVFAELSGAADLHEPRIVRGTGGVDAVELALRVDRLRAALDGPSIRGSDAVAAVEDVLVQVVSAGRPAGHWRAAHDYIRAQIDDPGLGVAAVAAAVGIGERQLAREFAARGTTVSREITDRRMTLARALVAESGPEQLAISIIAARVGFVSSAHFARAFRRAHGVSASELRRRVRAGLAA